MYLGKRVIFDPEKYEKRRNECIKFKLDATVTAFSELEGIINRNQLAQQYFNKSTTWINKRLRGCYLINKDEAFNEDEFHQLAEAFRDIAKRLMAHADEIDAAKYE